MDIFEPEKCRKIFRFLRRILVLHVYQDQKRNDLPRNSATAPARLLQEVLLGRLRTHGSHEAQVAFQVCALRALLRTQQHPILSCVIWETEDAKGAVSRDGASTSSSTVFRKSHRAKRCTVSCSRPRPPPAFFPFSFPPHEQHLTNLPTKSVHAFNTTQKPGEFFSEKVFSVEFEPKLIFSTR